MPCSYLEFLRSAMRAAGTKNGVVYLSPSKFQPVAADDVAAAIVTHSGCVE